MVGFVVVFEDYVNVVDFYCFIDCFDYVIDGEGCDVDGG